MDAKLCLEPSNESTRERARNGAREHNERNLENGGEVAGDAHDGRSDGTQDVLALGANVEEANLEGKGNGNAAEQKRRGLDNNVNYVARTADHAREERCKRGTRIVSCAGKNDCRD